METRANHIWVGAVTLALLAALAIFIVWLVQLGEGQQKEYDVLFGQSVEGLAKGSQVSFAGVPVGQVRDITLFEENPAFVRVRIRVQDDVPILVGTTATVQGSFTGVSTILLDGARQGAPPITCATTSCLEDDIPQIPPKAGGLGALLSNAPLLMERLSTLTEQTSALLSDENQREFSGILANSNRLSRQLADSSPQIGATLRELQGTLKEASAALAAFEATAQSADGLLNGDAKALASQLRTTLASAEKASNSLSVTLDSAEPAARRLNDETLPAAEAMLADLQATSAALRDVTERLEEEGGAALLSSPPLPEYEP